MSQDLAINLNGNHLHFQEGINKRIRKLPEYLNIINIKQILFWGYFGFLKKEAGIRAEEGEVG